MNTGKIIDIRGRKLGGETPLICSPLVGRTRERLLAEAATVVAKKPDVIEWRVDYFEGIGDTAAVLDTGKGLRAAAGDTPIIFTRRSTREGGEPMAIDDEAVVRLYDAVSASRLVDFLDFELSNDAEHVRRVGNVAD
jgi:3-dehydroquinate dehydratase-1